MFAKLRRSLTIRLLRLRYLFHAAFSNPRFHELLYAVASLLLLNILFSVTFFYFINTYSGSIPVDISVSTTVSAVIPFRSIIYSVQGAVSFLLLIVAVSSFLLKEALEVWDRFLPFPVALLKGVVRSTLLRTLYYTVSFLFVFVAGLLSDSRLSIFGILLLWELILIFQFVIYHAHNPKYEIPTLYASYNRIRIRQLTVVVCFSLLSFFFLEFIGFISIYFVL